MLRPLAFIVGLDDTSHSSSEIIASDIQERARIVEQCDFLNVPYGE